MLVFSSLSKRMSGLVLTTQAYTQDGIAASLPSTIQRIPWFLPFLLFRQPLAFSLSWATQVDCIASLTQGRNLGNVLNQCNMHCLTGFPYLRFVDQIPVYSLCGICGAQHYTANSPLSSLLQFCLDPTVHSNYRLTLQSRVVTKPACNTYFKI
jgi:hypothetical protein